MSDVMSSRAKPMKPLTCSKKGRGGEPGMKLLVEEVRAVKGEAQITLWSKKLANRAGWFSSNTAYATLSKLREDGNYVLVARTPTAPKGANPMWPTMTISMARLCNGDMDRPLRLTVQHQESASKTIEVGHMDVPVSSLLQPNWEGQLKHPKGKPKTCGSVKSMKPVIIERPTFVEYLQGGLEIGLCLAIDFTASNGEPSNPASLHAQIPGGTQPPNAYEQAIAGVGAILAPYDSSGVFCCYGYGAALPPNYVVSQCFALNGNPRSPGCQGIDGVLAAYRKALSVVRLSGPTCFAPVLKAACDIAEAGMNATPPKGLSKYIVFLIITGAHAAAAPRNAGWRAHTCRSLPDGTIMDMDETIDACVRASRLPMSVVIAGVGSADFTAMHALDSDDRRLAGRNGKAMRDAVNFVPLKDYKGLASGARLARDILQEIPLQVCQYFAAKGVPPPPPVAKAPAADGDGAAQEPGTW